MAQAVGSLSERHQRILPALLSGADIEYLRDVYPFHPALHRNAGGRHFPHAARALRPAPALRAPGAALPGPPAGRVPPGWASAFEAIFPEAGVEASKKVETMQDIHHQYYSRLRPAMRKMLEDRVGDFNEERRKALDQIVKTVLLAEVSSRLRRGGLTIEQLVQLNSVDVEGETFRGQVRVAENRPALPLPEGAGPATGRAGQDGHHPLQPGTGVNLGEFLARARSKVDHSLPHRFKVFYAALKKALGIHEMKGFHRWRGPGGTGISPGAAPRRVGRLELGKTCARRPTRNSSLPAGTFKVIIDYPWDDPGHSVDEDRHRAANAPQESMEKKRPDPYTACWLPRQPDHGRAGRDHGTGGRPLSSGPGPRTARTICWRCSAPRTAREC